MKKTNVMRMLDQKKIPYQVHHYQHDDGAVDGVEVAQRIHQNEDRVYKTLVCQGKQQHYVFVIPVAAHLDLKKCAKAVGEKSIDLIPTNTLLATTGYVRGGCSPIGMKKRFPTVFDRQCLNQETIIFSAGVIGTQVEVAVTDAIQFVGATTADIVE